MFYRALVELHTELYAGFLLSFVPQSSYKALQLYIEGCQRRRKRLALVFTILLVFTTKGTYKLVLSY